MSKENTKHFREITNVERFHIDEQLTTYQHLKTHATQVKK